jgi:thioesterase domain-containing protein
MPDTPALSEAKRSLLEKYLVGKLPQKVITVNVSEQLPETDASAQRARVVIVQTGKTRRPFFYLPGDSPGSAFYCHPLARALGEDQPFYILEPYNFDGLPVPPSFEEMAAAHLKSMRAIQPEGPYLLGGWCNGGLVAYEMAQQLHAQGPTVELLVLMDSDPPAKYERDRRISTGLCTLLRLDREKQLKCFLLYRRLRVSFHHWRLNILKRKNTIRQGEPGHERSETDAIRSQLDSVITSNENALRGWERIFDWMASGYIPDSYPGKITFFWTSEESFRQDKWRKWTEAKTLANEVETYIIPGNHITSRTQYLSFLAERLRNCLDEAQKALQRKQGEVL